MKIDRQEFVSFITVKQALAKNTIKGCSLRFGVFFEWLGEKPLNREQVEKFFLHLREKGLNNNTLNSYRVFLIHLRDFCADRGLPSDFLYGFKAFKKHKSEIIIFTQEEIIEILNTHLEYGMFQGKSTEFLDERYLTFTMFLAYTGVRFSEAKNLKIKYLDLSACRVSIVETKTNRNRSVYIIEPLISKLKDLIKERKPDDYVFVNAKGNKFIEQEYAKDLKRRAIKAGITKRVFPHNFRHTYATMLLEADVSITEVANLLGHKDIRTTFETYSHLADKTLYKAAMRHPMVRTNIDPKEILHQIKDTMGNYHIDKDSRFNFSVNETEKSLRFELIKK